MIIASVSSTIWYNGGDADQIFISDGTAFQSPAYADYPTNRDVDPPTARNPVARPSRGGPNLGAAVTAPGATGPSAPSAPR